MVLSIMEYSLSASAGQVLKNPLPDLLLGPAAEAPVGVLPMRREISRDPDQAKPNRATPVRSGTLQDTTPDRKFLLQTQAVPGHRYPLRQNRKKFPRRRPSRRRYNLAQLTTRPNPFMVRQRTAAE